ncbi:hypothetical protein BOTBODRAFT_512433 [Botryobasidium botryosum FD-172 SS1]|uniref:Uncharacterized protein n=1 Tax=Botryobasidium botryosum (strain FD-172 SS1) TaxID=930990 RepID=A0A067MRU0_BOTB1|nr:hypothetical protein BOTBODRAFT_512433 [Botryobasidium botryosum FD-172 SS1]
MSACQSCGAQTVYVPETFSEICISCGSLSDASQVQLYTPEIPGEGSSWYAGPSMLRTVRGGRMLAGQESKEMRDRRKRLALHNTIQNLLTRLSHSGLAPRAINLFDLAMKKGGYRWGKKATLVAGASMAIAMRELNKGETLDSLASLMSVSPISLSRIFLQVKLHTNVSLPPTDVILFFQPLLNLIKKLIAEPTSAIPSNLRDYLSEVSLSAILSLATSLAVIAGEIKLADQRRTPPVACAILLVAFEGETAKAMPSLDTMVAWLVNQEIVKATKLTIMERYREVGRLLDDCKRRLPWFEQTTQSRKRKGAASGKEKKLAAVDRVDNARWVKDVITFQEDLWKSEHAKANPEPGDSDDEDQSETASTLSGLMSPGPSGSSSSQPTKRRRTDEGESAELRHRPAAYVYAYPERHPRYKKGIKVASTSLLALESHSATGKIPALIPGNAPEETQSFRSHLLSASFLPTAAPPTRLALLAAAKGEGAIEDDELFEEGELEGFIRDETEVEEIRQIRGEEWSGDWEDDDKLLGGVDEDTRVLRLSPDDTSEPLTGATSGTAGGEEVIGEWRELSPGANAHDYAAFDTFDDADW